MDTAALRYGAQRFHQASIDMQARVQRISSHIEDTASWQGVGAQSFSAAAGHLREDVQTAQQGFERMAQGLNLLSIRLEHVNELRRQIEQLQAQIRSLEGDLWGAEERERASIHRQISSLSHQCSSLEYSANSLEQQADQAASREFDDIGTLVNRMYFHGEAAAARGSASVLDEMGDFFAGLWTKGKDVYDHVAEGWHEFADFSEGFAATWINNMTMGLWDPLHEDAPEMRNRSYLLGRVTGDMASAAIGAVEIDAGGGMVAGGMAEAGFAAAGVVTAEFSVVGLAVAGVGVGIGAHGAAVAGRSVMALADDWDLLSASHYEIKLRNEHLAGKDHPKTEVPFDEQGFPVFEAKYEMELPPEDYLKSRDSHFTKLNKQLYEDIKKNPHLKMELKLSHEDLIFMKAGITPDKYTWHHHQDPGRMQLVDSKIHAKTGHTGGYKIWGKDNLK